MLIKAPARKAKVFTKLISSALVVCFTATTALPPAMAQSVNLLNLPVPGAMVNVSPAFVPVLLKGMTVDPADPLSFDFIVDSGTNASAKQVKDESARLVKYFLAAMTVPKDDFWVNLSPYESDKIIPNELGKTELGRDLLAQDYILKQLTASMLDPEKDLGKEFWQRVYKKAEEQFGTSRIPVNTFNKVWILPERAAVYEYGRTVYVTETRLKVMLDSDYRAMQAEQGGAGQSDTNELEMQEAIVRDLILPEIEKEVNEGKNFAPLRQIYYALILAKWYKDTVKDSLLSKVYIDQNKTGGVNVDDPTIKDQIYSQYMAAYKKGVFNYIKEDYDRLSREPIPRKYFSGGIPLARTLTLEEDKASSPLTRGQLVTGDSYDMSVTLTPTTAGVSLPVKIMDKIPGTTDWYIRRLQDGDSAVRAQAAQKLGEKGDLRAVVPLLAQWGDEDEGVRAAVGAALDRFPLTDDDWDGALNGDDWRARAAAMDFLLANNRTRLIQILLDTGASIPDFQIADLIDAKIRAGNHSPVLVPVEHIPQARDYLEKGYDFEVEVEVIPGYFSAGLTQQPPVTIQITRGAPLDPKSSSPIRLSGSSQGPAGAASSPVRQLSFRDELSVEEALAVDAWNLPDGYPFLVRSMSAQGRPVFQPLQAKDGPEAGLSDYRAKEQEQLRRAFRLNPVSALVGVSRTGKTNMFNALIRDDPNVVLITSPYSSGLFGPDEVATYILEEAKGKQKVILDEFDIRLGREFLDKLLAGGVRHILLTFGGGQSTGSQTSLLKENFGITEEAIFLIGMKPLNRQQIWDMIMSWPDQWWSPESIGYRDEIIIDLQDLSEKIPVTPASLKDVHFRLRDWYEEGEAFIEERLKKAAEEVLASGLGGSVYSLPLIAQEALSDQKDRLSSPVSQEEIDAQSKEKTSSSVGDGSLAGLRVELSTRRAELMPEAQALVDFLAKTRLSSEELGQVNEQDPIGPNDRDVQPVILALGSPSPAAFRKAALDWSQYRDWGLGEVPVVASTGRGRGYKSFLLKTLSFLRNAAQSDTALNKAVVQRFEQRYAGEIENAERMTPDELFSAYNNVVNYDDRLKVLTDQLARLEAAHEDTQQVDALIRQLGPQPSPETVQATIRDSLTEAKIIQLIFESYGVPHEVIKLEEKSNQTMANVVESHDQYLKALAEQAHKPLKIRIVAAGFHRMRSLLTAYENLILGNRFRHADWQLNAEDSDNIDLSTLGEDDFAEYVTHMVGNPLDPRGSGEIERLVDYGLMRYSPAVSGMVGEGRARDKEWARKLRQGPLNNYSRVKRALDQAQSSSPVSQEEMDARIKALWAGDVAAARWLGASKDIRAAEPLLLNLDNDELRMRDAARRALRQLRQDVAGVSEQLLQEDIRLLENNDPAIRSEAVDSLLESEDRRAVGPLLGLLSDPDDEVRDQLETALVFFGIEERVLESLGRNPEQLPLFINAYRQQTAENQSTLTEAGVRNAAQLALSQITGENWGEKASSPAAETAGKDVGGIDFNAIDVEHQGEAGEIRFDPADLEAVSAMDIDGFVPVILNIIPLPSILPLLGLDPLDEAKPIEVSKAELPAAVIREYERYYFPE